MAVVAVAGASMVAQVLLIRAAERDRQAVVYLAQLYIQVNDLHGKQWAAIGTMEDQGPEAAAEPLEAFANALDAFSTERAPQSVQAALAPYLSDLSDVLALLHANDAIQAQTMAIQRIEPKFEQVLDSVAGATTLTANHAQETARVSQVGSIIAMVAATALIGFLFWRFERSRESTRALELEQEALQKSEARFRRLVQHSSDIIMVVEPDLTIRYASPAVEVLLAQRVGDLVGRKLTGLAHADAATGIAALLPGVEPQESVRTELQLRHADGSYRDVELIGTNLVHDEHIRGFVLNGRDVTDRKALEERLRHQAFHDALTVLPNRVRLQERLEHALQRAHRQNTTVALLFIDLDDFKTINDTLGHSAGDEVLVRVAERLRSCLREMDTASRLGGDEFAVLLEDLQHASDATTVAERIFEALKEPVPVGEHHLNVQASIGIVLMDLEADETVQSMLRNADIAMYVAKARGKARYEVFNSRMHEGMLERLALRGDLEQALAKQELELHYQPIVELESHEIVSLEALLRWRHPNLGIIQAADFVPAAEETGLIVPIGSWVLREACRQWRSWRDERPDGWMVTISVNVSAKQFERSGFVDEVASVLEETGMDPNALILELTESATIRDTERSIARMDQIRRLGVKLALDDFGTGHSSFNYLRQLPLDMLKIDRSYIEALGEADDRESLVRAIVQVSQALGLQIVPEGVEREDQAVLLSKLGCSLAQGYYFSRPAPAGEVEKLLDATPPAQAA